MEVSINQSALCIKLLERGENTSAGAEVYEINAIDLNQGRAVRVRVNA